MGRRDANFHQDWLFQAKARDCPSAWDAKVGPHVGESPLHSGVGLRHQVVLAQVHRREQVLPAEMQLPKG
ncbi:MAG: hypothetical protein PVS2B2_23920 [Candidatus Acidiferrum sp.]